MEKRNLSKKLKHGSASALYTALFLVAIFLVYTLSGLLSDRLGLHFDMTKDGIYQISQQTIDYLGNMEDEVTITVLAEQSDFETIQGYAELNEILRRYQGYAGDKLQVRYVSVHKNPTFLARYENLPTLREGAMIIESAKRYTAYQVEDFYEFATDAYTQQLYVSAMAAEQKLTSGLIFVNLDTLPRVELTTGHDEGFPAEFEELLTQNNFDVKYTNLLQEDLSPETNLIIISAPQRDFASEEVEKIDAFLEGGGNLIFLSGLGADRLPVLSRFAGDWGVGLSGGVVVDPSRSVGDLSYLSPLVIKSDVTTTLESRTNTILMLSTPGGLTRLWEDSGYRRTVPLLRSSEQSYAKDGESVNASLEQESGDSPGPFYLGVMGEERRTENNQTIVSRAMFFSSETLINSDFLNTSNLMNRPYLASVLSYLYDQGDSIVVEPRNMTSEQLTVTGFAANVIFWFMVVILPLFILLMGFRQWRKRRNL